MKDTAYEIAINRKYDGYKRGLASIVYKFFDKKAGSGTKANVNEVLAQELYKPVIKNLKEGKCMRGLKIIYGQQIYLKWLSESKC